MKCSSVLCTSSLSASAVLSYDAYSSYLYYEIVCECLLNFCNF